MPPVLENNSASNLDMRERQYLAAEDRYGHEIQVPPSSTMDVASAVFQSRNHHSGRPSEIVLFVDGTKFEKSLTPATFAKYQKLIFEVDAFYLLRVYGIPGRPLDLFRKWLCGLLGRDYRVRGRVLILKTIACRKTTEEAHGSCTQDHCLP